LNPDGITEPIVLARRVALWSDDCMAGSTSIASKAARAAESLTSQAEAPAANDCCAAGQAAFATSENVLAAEYAQMVTALDQATAELAAQAEANQVAWVIAEQTIQTWSSVPSAQLANRAAMLVIAEANVTEAAFSSASSTLSAEIANAEVAIQLAENVLSAEQAVFVATAGCNAEAETAG
jgi:hypothetical protein